MPIAQMCQISGRKRKKKTIFPEQPCHSLS